MSRRRTLSLRSRLLLGTLAVLLASLSLVAYSSWTEYERAHESILDDLQQTAQSVAVIVEATFDQAILVGMALAELPEIQTRAPADATARLRAARERYPFIRAAVLLDEQGDLIATAAPEPLPDPRLSLADRAYFQDVRRTGRPAVADLVRSARSGLPLGGVAIPVRDGGGALRGVLLLGFDADEVGARLRLINLRPGQSILVADRNARLAYFSDPTTLTWEQRDASSFPNLRRALAGETVRVSSTSARLQGDVRIGVSAPTPVYGWAVGVTWPTSEAFGALDDAFRTRMLLFGVLALLAAGVAVLLSRSMLRPIHQLDEQATALGRGELHRRVAIGTGDELERLGNTFNVMAAQLERALGDLQHRERQLRRLGDSGIVGVIFWDVSGEITEANDEFLRMVGYSRADLERGLIDWRHLTPESYRAIDDDKTDELHRTGAQTPYEKEYTRKDGTLVPVLVGAAFFEDSRDRGLSFVLDLTERKQLERLQQGFIASVSHELRNPLTSIRGFAQLMRRREVYDPRAISVILTQTTQLDRIIGDLLDASRIQAGALELRLHRCDLVEIARTCVEELQATTDIHVIVVDAPDARVIGTWDGDRLSQVFRNLVGNAIKYSPEGGEIVVRVARDGQEGQTAEIVVRDQGRGIEPGVLPQLFGRFYRAADVRDAVRGAGLGLYVTRELVELHGGRIWAESAGLGQGATFRVSLPCEADGSA